MRKGILIIALFLLSATTFANNLLAINFQQKDEVSYLDFLFDQEGIDVKRFHVVDDKQIIVDIKGAEATDRVMRAFDTSEFSGSVVFVSAYKKPGGDNEIRVVLQLRDNVRSKIEAIGKRVVLKVENRFGVFNKRDLKQSDELKKKKEVRKSISKLNIPKSESVEDILENITLSGKKKYIGKKITLNVKNMPVSTVIEMVADASGFNIIQSSDISKLKSMSLSLINIPWDQVLDTVLQLNDLVAEKNGSILTIKTLEQATKERKAKEAASAIKVKAEPVVTKIFPVSYAKAKDLTDIFKDYTTSGRGAISIDERTNSIIVKDTQGTIEKIGKILSLLDTQTPQVLIQSKIVEVFEDYAREVGLTSGVNFGYDPVGTQAGTPSIIGNTPSATENGGPGFSFSTAPSTGDNARSLFGLTIGRFGRLFNLNFQLQLLESEAKGKIIASPRVVTKHNQKAKIVSKDETSYVEREGTGEDATVTFKVKEATLQLEVTPLVTNDGAIDLLIDLKKEQFGNRPSADAPPNLQTREVKTSVLVDNGSTIVLGGLYNYEKRESHSGVPFLKDVPLIGWLFRTPYNPSTTKQELVIFITPRIVNQEKAGLVNSI
jgi:type IV pilus assembly protein PilQ